MARRPWAYFVVTHGWPVGIGVSSEALSREARYRALDGFDTAFGPAMDGLAATVDTEPEEH